MQKMPVKKRNARDHRERHADAYGPADQESLHLHILAHVRNLLRRR